MLQHFEAVTQKIVSREDEVREILATLGAGQHLILEGPPGTSKSTILRAITEVANLPIFIVEGSVDLTPARLVGHFTPSKVLADDYRRDYFEKGPLPCAMEGGILYIEEFNRVPADTTNVLITAVEEGELVIPRYGVMKAAPEFRVVCAQNPYDDVGTLRISRAIYDRFCRISLSYQGMTDELEIVRRKTGSEDDRLIKIAVRAARETRRHQEIKQGASVRGAMDMLAIAKQLRRIPGADEMEVLRAAMLSAMSGKIWLEETTERTPEEILQEILNQVLTEEWPAIAQPGQPAIGEGKGESTEDQRVERMEKRVHAREKRIGDAGQKRHGRWEHMGTTPDEVSEQLRRLSRTHPDEALEFLHSNRELAEDILKGPDVLELYGRLGEGMNAELRAIARRYASRLIVKMASQIANLGVNSGPLRHVQAPDVSDEIAIGATIERIIDSPISPMEEQLVVRARRPEQKACVVMLDHSDSMTGLKLSMAALTASVIALHFKRDYGVVVFNTGAQVLKRMTARKSPTQMAAEILSLLPRGYTNIRQALEVGIRQIQNFDKKIGILITDGDWNHGGNPLPIARLFDTLHVIGLEEPIRYGDVYDDDVEYVHYSRQRHYDSRIERLAKEGRGRFAYVESIEDVPAAITRCLIVSSQ
ncbi:MAG: AAA family ATPase [Anaerolineae bacterium]